MEYEGELAQRFRAIGVQAERNLTETRTGNAGDLVLNIPLSVQAKVGQMPPVLAAMRQAEDSARGDEIPVAMVKWNGVGSTPPKELTILRTADFFELLRKLLDHEPLC